jgi:sugar lactone lactonase YvrE
MFICADCAKNHLKMKKLFSSHKVSTLDELREGGAQDVVIQEPSFKVCEVHEQPMNIYCYDCKSLICRDCTIKLHRDHNHEFVKVAAPEMKQKLLEQLNPLRKSCGTIHNAIDDIKTTISEVEGQGLSIAKQIEGSFAELLDIIERRKRELLTEAATRVEEKSQHLSEQGKGLSIACAAVESVIDYTEHCVEHSADDEIMCMHTEIQSRISREIEEQQKERRDLEPVEEADLGVEVNCAEDLKQLCQTTAKMIFLVDGAKSLVTGKGARSAEVSKASHIKLFTKLSNGRPTKQACVVASSLKSLANDSTTECRVERLKGNEYCIQYTPTVRGHHELSVTVNGQAVAGSPFPVFVSIHPTLLGKPVRPVITGVDNARDVAVTPTGNIFVTHMSNFILFNKNGKKLRDIDISKSISHPIGVAVDSTDGCIYVCGGSKVIKLSPDFKLVGEFTGERGVDNQYLAIVGEEVMVSEDSKKVVMVYTKDLKYVRQISSHGDRPGQFLRIRGVASDEHNNLYVSDGERRCVHVYSNGGEFLHSIGQGRDCAKNPIGVCVFGQYVYVANNGSHCVSVFTTKGEYVTSFGQEGRNEGDLKHPWGVCVDKNGFVYVCDAGNDRVQIF